MNKPVVGFDSLLFSRSEIEHPNKEFKALMAVGVTVENKKSFKKTYENALLEVFKDYEINRKKVIYKSFHFCAQVKDHASKMICNLLEKLSDEISRIDIYYGVYDLPEISIFGEAAGETIKRLTFIDRNQHGFHHVCAWDYCENYGHDSTIELDHFEGWKTPAWEELVDKTSDINVYYKGSECNSVISIADLVLKLIQIHQHGHLSSSTLVKPIKNNCPSFNGYGRLNYHSMKKHLKKTTPTVPYFIDFANYIKHPIFYVIWNPDVPRSKVKPMFEWSPTYNAVIKKAHEEDGCLKMFSNIDDHLMWSPKEDRLVAWSDVDEEVIDWIKAMGYEIPKVIKKENLLNNN